MRQIVKSAARQPSLCLRRNLSVGLKSGPKTVATVEEAVQHVPSSSRVYLHGVACTPIRLLEALSQRKDIEGIEFCHLHLEGQNPCMAHPDRFFSNAFFVGHTQRADVAEGHGSYIPTFLSEIPNLMKQGHVTPEVALVQVTPPDRHGYCSLGPEVSASLTAVKTAKLVIGQINRHMPRTWGTSTIPYNALDVVVECDAPLFEIPVAPLGPVDLKIGQHIASMVKDGATLQMGIGAIPNAVLASLTSHKHLGIHTEMMGEGAMELMKRGVVDNTRKRFMPDQTVASFALGTRALYDFIDDNPGVVFLEANVSNNPVLVGSNPDVVAVNSAVEIDLTGQVCADSVGTRHISGVGGQVDFIRGAALSEGGLPIICFPSTTKSGASKIVSMLRPGAGVVTTRAHVHYVVTEHGIAKLIGKNLQERAKALIQIAHPNHRAALEKEAYERFRFKTWQ